MRPIQKPKVGSTIILPDGTDHKISKSYSPYSRAVLPLKAAIGSYCSYCEDKIKDPQLEHVIPKDQDPTLENSYDNFLLACPRCNGRDNKSNKRVNLSTCMMPHRDNTHLAIQYLEGGLVKANTTIDPDQIQKAKNLISLVGLDKHPHAGNTPSTRDSRWRERYEAWNKARSQELQYRNQKIDIDAIVTLCTTGGYFSIFYTVFRSHTDVQNALIEAFPGTRKECFEV